MAKTVQYYANGDMYMIWCPGCKCRHYIPVRNPEVHTHVWHFNGNDESPSFHPSVRYYVPSGQSICHFFVTDGEIRFQADCQHELAAQNVPLLDFRQWPVR